MVTRSLLAVYGASLLQLAIAGDTTNTAFISSPTAQPTSIRALQYQGCYKSSAPMINHGPYTFQSSGNCQKICLLLGNSAMGLTNGSDCYCGDELPDSNDKVDDSNCSTKCNGYPEQCGGGGFWTVYTTGYTLNQVPHYNEAAASASTSSSSSAATTASASSSKKASSGGGGGGSSTVGIAVGVVVGIIALAALAGGGFLYFRRRQQRQMEEYKQQVDAPSFFGSNNNSAAIASPETRPSMWAPDNRLGGAGNRNSVGSIADNQDYSRRILAVRNPDGF